MPRKIPGCGCPPRSEAKGGLLRVAIVIAVFLALAALVVGRGQEKPAGEAPAGGLLKLLAIEPSAESVDYVLNKTQFQLHTLLTEQRHQKTWYLGERIQEDTLAGLKMLSAVDDDIAARMDELAAAPEAVEQAARAVEGAIRSGRKIYVYGCGATGRLAKQMESTFWRPFWRGVKADERIWKKAAGRLPAGEAIDASLIGEMTGADRALISSLEGFEDLQLIGRLQLHDRGIEKGDVVVCVTEGGETSSVIGTVRAALEEWKSAPGYDPAESRKSLYFVYNNPDDRLMPFERSRTVLVEPGITKINLTTGPQAITGSTRMQATTIETCVVAAIVETAVERVLGPALGARDMEKLGFAAIGARGAVAGEPSVTAKLREFGSVLTGVRAALADLAKLTDIEAAAYAGGHFSTYYAERGLITVFIDSTERSPTFRLLPLDTVKEPRRKCWIQVWTDAATPEEAWRAFLGRPFRGLSAEMYRRPFETEVEDPYLRRSALESLKKAGDEQADLYDFSLSKANTEARGPKRGDLGVLVALTPEERELADDRSGFARILRLAAEGGADAAALVVTDRPEKEFAAVVEPVKKKWAGAAGRLVVVPVSVRTEGDPFRIRQQMAAKMLLNAHSTAVMAKLGKVVGNTMTNVSPSNLKLIGRATFLIQSHVNDVLGRPEWVKAHGARGPIRYGEANAVLYDSIAYLRDQPAASGQTAEVAFSIIRILESLKQKRGIPHDEALALVKSPGLLAYLASIR